MKNIFIIGNGFDLNLGLETSYQHFINSDDFQGKVSEGNALFSYLKKRHDIEGWIDVESELANYSLSEYSMNNFYSEYINLCDCLKTYIKSIGLSKIDKGSKAFNMLGSIDLSDDFLIVNFNYTDSIFHILEELGHQNVQGKILHVHGSITRDEIVFGVDDNARINPDHVFLYKSYSPIFGVTYDFEKLSCFENFYFFGHSLGESDHVYFANLLARLTLKGSKAQKVHFYHYNLDSKNNIVRQLQKLTSNQLGLLKMKVSFVEECLCK